MAPVGQGEAFGMAGALAVVDEFVVDCRRGPRAVLFHAHRLSYVVARETTFALRNDISNLHHPRIPHNISRYSKRYCIHQ